MKYSISAVTVLLVAVLAVWAGVATPAIAQGGTTLPAPAHLTLRNGAYPGDVIVSWSAVPEAAFYRIAWASSEDVAAQRSQGGNWWDAVRVAGVENLGQTAYTVNNLETGVAYYFRVGSDDTRFGEAEWSPWQGPLTVGVNDDCIDDGDASMVWRQATRGNNRSGYDTVDPRVGINAYRDECATDPSRYSGRITRSISSELARLSDAGSIDLPSNRLMAQLTARTGNPSMLERSSPHNYSPFEPMRLWSGRPSNLAPLKLAHHDLVGMTQSTPANGASLIRLSPGSGPLNSAMPAPAGVQDFRRQGSRFTGIAADQPGHFPNPAPRYLSDHRLSRSLPTGISLLSELGQLRFSNSPWGGAMPPTLNGIPNLPLFGFGASQFSGSISPELGNLSWMLPYPSGGPAFER